MTKTTDKTRDTRVNDQAAAKEQAQAPKKRTNKTWEAFGKSKGCFIINDPKFML